MTVHVVRAGQLALSGSPFSGSGDLGKSRQMVRSHKRKVADVSGVDVERVKEAWRALLGSSV